MFLAACEVSEEDDAAGSWIDDIGLPDGECDELSICRLWTDWAMEKYLYYLLTGTWLFFARDSESI